MTHECICAEIETIDSAYEQAVTQLASTVRAAHVVPICDRHKLRFFAGNGIFFFTPDLSEGYNINATRFSDESEAVAAGYDSTDIIDAVRALEVDVDRFLAIGHWMEGYSPAA